MSTRPTVTVGLPVYNGEPYLSSAIESILAQTHDDLRLVISDNGSTDGTQAICERFARDDERLYYERHDVNRGAAWNYNRVFELSRSPFFKWGAADDLLARTCIERCYEALTTAPATVVLCYPKTLILDECGEAVGEHADGLDVRSSRPHNRFAAVARNVVLGNALFGLVRREALARTRLHGSYPSADWVLLGELALIGEFWELDERLFMRRLHEGTSRASSKSLEELVAWFDPEATGISSERRTLFDEYLASIRHAQLSDWERALTYASFLAVWTRRHSRVVRWARARRSS